MSLLKDHRTPDQQSRGVRRIDGHEAQDYYRRHAVPIRYQCWLEMKWVSLSYSIPTSALVCQCVSWAYYTHYARPGIKQRLGCPQRGGKKQVFASIKLNWSPEMVARAGALIERVAGSIAHPWPDGCDKVGILITSCWEEFRKRNLHLSRVEPGVPQNFDPATLCFLKTTVEPRGTKVQKIRPPEDEDDD